MKNKKSILLASQSPRRRELLSLTGLDFDVASADVDESLLPGESPAEYVLRLAEEKAQASALARPAGEELVVIGSDTAVVDAGETLGKPRDTREAKTMLSQLRGRIHQVYTAIAVYDLESDKIFSELSISDVPMRNYSDVEMDAYIQSGDPMDKAGGYAIQHPEFRPVENFSGCFASVMGLPLCLLAWHLQKTGIIIETNLPQVCQSSLGYECTISDSVLNGSDSERRVND